MSIRIPEPKKNGDKLLVWWLRSSIWERRYGLVRLFFFAFVWLTGAYFAPRDVVEIGRLTGWGQTLAALSMGAMTLVWNQLVVQGYIVDNAQAPSSLWWLLVWIGPAGVVYFIWLLHQEVWPWDRLLAWVKKKWEKRPRWLRRKRKERLKNGYEVLQAWEKMIAQKEVGRKRPVVDEDSFFSWEPKPNPPARPAVRKTSPSPSQGRVSPAKLSAEVKTAVEEASQDKGTVQAAKKSLEKPLQLTLPMVETGEKSDKTKGDMAEDPMVENEQKRRPGRPGAGRRRWRR